MNPVNCTSTSSNNSLEVNDVSDDTSEFSEIGQHVYTWIVKAKHPIVLVGESENRSLSLAIACMRDSLDDIWVTVYDGITHRGENIKDIRSRITVCKGGAHFTLPIDKLGE